MCGIIGAVAQRDVSPVLLEGLKRLEYRGYDSAGMAVFNAKGNLQRHRTQGKVCELESLLLREPLLGTTGIAHTRWATHGKPCEYNAHPMTSSDRIALVHNGVIENHDKLRQFLQEKNYAFSSDTDTEIVAHLLHFYLTSKNKNIPDTKPLVESVRQTIKQLKGNYAFAIIDMTSPDQIITVRHGSPLVIGLGIGENFVASDPLALHPVSQQFIYLEDGDIATIQRQQVTIYDNTDQIVTRDIKKLDFSHHITDRGVHRHYMQKEIFEQPESITNLLEGRLNRDSISASIFGLDANTILSQTKHVHIVACGTSYYTGLVARYWLEELAGISCQVDIASEFRYRQPVVLPNTLFITLSQSGETADTLSALRQAKKLGYLESLSICNVAESSLVRETNLSLLMHVGPEISVASTKAFTGQLASMLMLTIILGRLNQKITPDTEKKYLQTIQKLPSLMEQTLKLDNPIKSLAKLLADKQHAFFIGRGTHFPIALEGALKLKELSYIHAEGYPGGELKHGPLALLDKDMPVIALAPCDDMIDKLKSNLHEIKARGAQLIIFSDDDTLIKDNHFDKIIPMPSADKIITPILYTIPMQLLAYHVAVQKGTDVDQPRHLAKSVTVE